MTTGIEADIDRLLRQHPAHIQVIERAVRELIPSELPDVAHDLVREEIDRHR